MNESIKFKVFQVFNVILGCTLLAISLNVFLKPNNFVVGGVTGIGIILDKVFKNIFNTSFPLWLSNILINLPLFFISFKLFGKKFLGMTLFATLFLSVALILTEWLSPFTEDILLAAIFGAVLDGLGIGLIIKTKASTGGSDLLAIILSKFIKHIEIAKILFCIDFIIIFSGVFIFGIKPTLYAFISVFIVSRVVSAVIDGFDFAKSVTIITNEPKKIGDSILKGISRGATSIKGSGMYTNTTKNIIICVVKQKQIPYLKDIVNEIDKEAFIIISNANEVIGKGFSTY